MTINTQLTVTPVVIETHLTLNPITINTQMVLGIRGVGITDQSYNSATGELTLHFSDGVTFTTGDLRGLPGTPGTPGRSITNQSYNSSTGVLTLTFSDASTFSTGDLRGQQGLPGTPGTPGRSITNQSYNSSTGVLTLTFSDASTFSTGDLRGPGLIDLTGLALTNRAKVLATDTPLVAFGKLQSQIDWMPRLGFADNSVNQLNGIQPTNTILKVYQLDSSRLPSNGLCTLTFSFTYLQTSGGPIIRMYGIGSNSPTPPTTTAGASLVFTQSIIAATTARGIGREFRQFEYLNGVASIIAGTFNTTTSVHDFGMYNGIENGGLNLGTQYIYLIVTVTGGGNGAQEVATKGLYIDVNPVF